MKKKLGNSRLLYVEQDLKSVDINQAIALIDHFIALSMNVELALEKVYIYPKGERVWIGREVSGYPSQMPEGVRMEDYHSVEVLEEQLESSSEDFSSMIDKALAKCSRREMALLRLELDQSRFDTPIVQMVKPAQSCAAKAKKMLILAKNSAIFFKSCRITIIQVSKFTLEFESSNVT